MESQPPPTVPVRKYRPIIVSPAVLKEPTEDKWSNNSTNRDPLDRLEEEQIRNDTLCSEDDAISIASSALSVDSCTTTSAGSKYDNVKHGSGVKPESDGDADGDDEAELSEASSVSDSSIVLDSTSGGEADHPHHRRAGVPDLVPNHHHRGSGDYDNLRLNVSARAEDGQAKGVCDISSRQPRLQSIKDDGSDVAWAGPVRPGEKGRGHDQGLLSIRRAVLNKF